MAKKFQIKLMRDGVINDLANYDTMESGYPLSELLTWLKSKVEDLLTGNETVDEIHIKRVQFF